MLRLTVWTVCLELEYLLSIDKLLSVTRALGGPGWTRIFTEQFAFSDLKTVLENLIRAKKKRKDKWIR